MNKLLLFRAFIAGVATIMQFWLSIVVFNNDYQCRQEFRAWNSSINQQKCLESLNDVSEWHCKCEWFGSRTVCSPCDQTSCEYTDYWMRVSNDWAVAIAVFIFSALALIEGWRSLSMIAKICCNDSSELSSFEYCSPFGFLAMLLNPASFDIRIKRLPAESFMIVIDCLTIGLVFQYSSFSQTSINDPLMIVILVSSSCNGLGYLLNIFLINYQDRIVAKNKHKIVQERLIEHHIPIVPGLPPPYDKDNHGKDCVV